MEWTFSQDSGGSMGLADSLPSRPTTEVPRSRHIISEGRIVFSMALGIYVTVAVLLDFKYHAFALDAWSRMANGFYIVYSRDPHLAAVGFVWEPLTSLSDLVLLLGNHLWPALSQHNMAGSLMTALAMAGATYQILSALCEWGVSRIPRLVLTAFFALNPMVLYYAGNGMSEALYLFTLTATTRYLLRWMRDGDLRSLAYSGVALAFCYLTRNEAALATMLGGSAVAVVSYWRTGGLRTSRIKTALSDTVVFAAPALTAILGWAFTSYVIIGSFIDGGTLSIRLSGRAKSQATLHSQILIVVHDIGALAPFLPILFLAATAVAFFRRDPRVLAPLSVLGGALGFDMVSLMNQAIGGFLRYFIVAVPLGILLLGSLVAAIQTPRPARHDTLSRTPPSRAGVRALSVIAAVCLVFVVMIPTTMATASGMLNPHIGVEESDQIGFIFKAHPKPGDYFYSDAYPVALAMGRYFENKHLPDGDVVVDNATSCIPMMIVTSSQPKLFVINNDRDFQRILADPITFHAHYILEGDPPRTRPAPCTPHTPTCGVQAVGLPEWCTSSRPRRRPQVCGSSMSSVTQMRGIELTGHVTVIVAPTKWTDNERGAQQLTRFPARSRCACPPLPGQRLESSLAPWRPK